jgi:hypothetical protein
MPAKLRLHAAPATGLSLGGLLVLAVAGVVALSGAEAAGQGQPKCGDKITADTTLHHDLLDCPNNGIRIAADNITLDLNGHTIDGDGKPAAGCNPRKEFCDVGVVNFRHVGVTVMDGSMRQFDGGVVFGEVHHSRLLGISASRSRFVGISLFDSSRTLVRDSSVFRNGLNTDQAGIALFRARRTRILHNSIRHNGDIALFMQRSGHNQIRGNTLRHHPEAGVNVEGGNRNRIGHNLLTRDGDGIIIGGNRNAVTRNRVLQSRTGPQSGGNGIHAAAGHDNLIAHNIVGAAATGIRVSLKPDELGGKPGATNTVIRGNRLRGAHVDGVLVMSTARQTLLRRNRSRRSDDDGFDVESRTTKLTKNRASRNADLGIEAVRGVNDGGGNIARHNGDPRQCTNIACS